MFYFAAIFLITVVLSHCCEIIDQSHYKRVIYSEGETLDLTVREGLFPDDVEVTSISESCPSMVKLLPDQYFNDKFRKYKHEKQIRKTMARPLAGCVYRVAMKTGRACVLRRLASFEMTSSLARKGEQCVVYFDVRWLDEMRANYIAQEELVCDAQHAMCDERVVSPADIVLTSEQNRSMHSQKIKINLRNEEISENVFTFVCQANTITIKGKLITNDSIVTKNVVYYKDNEQYNATCHGSNVHWILEKDHQISIANKSFTKKLARVDDNTKLICLDINCDDLESNGICYKTILKEVTFQFNYAVRYDVVFGAVGVIIALSVVAYVVRRRSRKRVTRAEREIARRPRMMTPPPERPPRAQPYYSAPFERTMPVPRREPRM